jgi:hypothetical protein
MSNSKGLGGGILGFRDLLSSLNRPVPMFIGIP